MKIDHMAGLEIKFLSKEPNCIFKSYLKVVCKETTYIFGLPAEI